MPAIDFSVSTIPPLLLSKLSLPPAPQQDEEDGSGPAQVCAWEGPVAMLTYLPDVPDRNPMFLERRVYQGSSGDLYPLPIIDRVATEPVEKLWKAIHLENEFVRLLILPEIGGRIHVGLDKINGYDFFYRQNVIKPALVGLAGPWISGGVEFNWPQHHRPATFMPVETEIERHRDGSVTVWCSDYDPATGMKGMHGICLRPESTVVELKARLYNGTETTQTFLWWANVAARVNADYQSFFPPDVQHVADHARRAISTFPLADGSYYGVDYAGRAANGVPPADAPASFQPHGVAPNDLSRFANIPVPTSYMVLDTQGEFFGGYDHAAQAGFLHLANRHIAPGKKQWTWGNHEFGYAWDRSLTNDDGPYVELMAGVYTDNQPDFSYLAPGETKTFSQFWYPLRKCGVPLAANLDAAMRLDATDGLARIAICPTRELAEASVRLALGDQLLAEWHETIDLTHGFHQTFPLPDGCDTARLTLELTADSGHTLTLSLAPPPEKPARPTAVEPEAPEAILTVEELFLTGLHLEQYRHATRSPEPYWREAIRRDPGDARCNHALAKLLLKRGEYAEAETMCRTAIARATRLNDNPADGEVFYTLGLTLRRLQRLDEAYAAFYKATWNYAWRAAGHHALAEIDAVRGNLSQAIEHLQLSLRTNADNLNARNLCAALLRQVERENDANDLLADTCDLDSLDLWSRYLDGVDMPENGAHLLALGLLMERGGQFEDAIEVFKTGTVAPHDGAAPLLHLAIARCSAKLGDDAQQERHLMAATEASPDYCFPHSLDHLDLLSYALAVRPEVAHFQHYLGNLLYHHRRHEEAMAHWESSVLLDPANPQAWRNLAIGAFNIRHNAPSAQRAFNHALAASPHDARLLYESDQLLKRLKIAPALRLDRLLAHSSLVSTRDDLSVELTTLLNQRDRPKEALDVLLSRQFQPWEGGEGLVLAQFTAAHLRLGTLALERHQPERAVYHFDQPLHPPATLGEARHLLANCSDIHYWLGRALEALGDDFAATRNYLLSAEDRSDFQAMAVQPLSQLTYWSGLSLQRLGRHQEAAHLFEDMLRFAQEMEAQKASIDYFATSLPTLLLFDDDLTQRLKNEAQLIRAAAYIGLGKRGEAAELLRQVHNADPSSVVFVGLVHASQLSSCHPEPLSSPKTTRRTEEESVAW